MMEIILILLLIIWNVVLTYLVIQLKLKVDKSIPKELDYKLELLVRATAKHEMFIDSVKARATEIEARRKTKVR